MEVKDSAEPDGKLELPISPAGTVAIAIKGNKESKCVVAWALEKFIPEGNIVFKLLHVRRKTTAVPTASKLCLFGIISIWRKSEVCRSNNVLLFV